MTQLTDRQKIDAWNKANPTGEATAPTPAPTPAPAPIPEQKPVPPEVTNSVNNMALSLFGLEKRAQDSRGALGVLQDKYSEMMKGMENGQAVTEGAARSFALLTTFVTQTKTAYSGFGETGSINLFSSQLDKLTAGLPDTTAGANKLKDALGGMDLKVPTDLMGAGIGAISNFAKEMMKSSDNALRLTQGMLQLSASTGDLGSIYKNAGDNLQGMSTLLREQGKMMNTAQQATHMSRDDIEKYYFALGQVPGALKANVDAGLKAGDSVNMLTATMRMAAGVGRTQQAVIDDLKVAYNNLGLVGEPALKFVAQFTEVSTNLGLPLENIKRALTTVTSGFNTFVNSAEGAARIASSSTKIMNDYVSALQSAGIPGVQAVSIVENMTGAMSKLNVQQRALLSSQTGGPGGLMGAFQIEKDLREGKIEDVLKRAKDMMTKQFGKIVSMDEATKSPEAAAMYQKQRMMIQSGPLGSLAKTDTEAGNLLEGMRKMEGGRVAPGLKDNILQKSMEKGASIQEQTHTAMTDMVEGIDQLNESVYVTNLDTTQKAMGTAGSLSKPLEDERNKASREKLISKTQTAALGGGKSNKIITDEMAAGNVRDRSRDFDFQSFKNLITVFKDGLGGLGNFGGNIKQMLTPAKTEPILTKASLDAKIVAERANTNKKETPRREALRSIIPAPPAPKLSGVTYAAKRPSLASSVNPPEASTTGTARHGTHPTTTGAHPKGEQAPANVNLTINNFCPECQKAWKCNHNHEKANNPAREL